MLLWAFHHYLLIIAQSDASIQLLYLQTQFQGWRNKSSAIKAQTGELEEATDTVVLDIRQLGESVSKVIFHFMHMDQSLEGF